MILGRIAYLLYRNLSSFEFFMITSGQSSPCPCQQTNGTSVFGFGLRQRSQIPSKILLSASLDSVGRLSCIGLRGKFYWLNLRIGKNVPHLFLLYISNMAKLSYASLKDPTPFSGWGRAMKMHTHTHYYIEVVLLTFTAFRSFILFLFARKSCTHPQV